MEMDVDKKKQKKVRNTECEDNFRHDDDPSSAVKERALLQGWMNKEGWYMGGDADNRLVKEQNTK